MWYSLLAVSSCLIPFGAIAFVGGNAIARSEVSTPVAQTQPSVEIEPGSTAADPESETPDSTDPDSDPASDPGETSESPTPEDIRHQTLVKADRLYLKGEIAAAEQLYRTAKPPFEAEQTHEFRQLLDPIVDPEQLAPAGRVYWRESEAGLASNLETRIFVPLEMLVEQYPEFIPGHVRLTEALRDRDRLEDAVTVIDRAATLYPDRPEIIKTQVETLVAAEKWLEASMAARQFALLNPDRPDAERFARLADEHLDTFKKKLRQELRGRAVGSILTGAISLAVTGNPLGTLSSLQTTILLLKGESKLGEQVAEAFQERLEMMDDKVVLDYVNDLGKKLARLGGRDFDYDFYVVLDEDLNAFALPGGKVFVNAGAILKAQSEAELAGLLSHELSHAVLSHGFQRVAEATLLGNVVQFVPLGGVVGNIAMLDYSRDQERQADLLGTRILSASDYAADGLRNLMVTLAEETGSGLGIEWLSTHPLTGDRIRYLEETIVRNGYNRYAYEGVEAYEEIQARVERLLSERNAENNQEDDDETDREDNDET
jgi:predicted Zn-dependent protease